MTEKQRQLLIRMTETGDLFPIEQRKAILSALEIITQRNKQNEHLKRENSELKQRIEELENEFEKYRNTYKRIG